MKYTAVSCEANYEMYQFVYYSYHSIIIFFFYYFFKADFEIMHKYIKECSP